MPTQYEAKLRHAACYQELSQKANELYLKEGEATIRGVLLFKQRWGNIRAGFQWSRENLDSEEAAKICSKYLYYAAESFNFQATDEEQKQWLQDALRVSRAINLKEHEISHLSNLGKLFTDISEHQQSQVYLEQAVKICEETGDRLKMSTALDRLAQNSISIFEDLSLNAIVTFKELMLFAVSAPSRMPSKILRDLSPTKKHNGLLASAFSYAFKSMMLARQEGDPRKEALALSSMADILDDTNAHWTAEYLYLRAISICQSNDLNITQASISRDLAICYRKLGRYDEAIQLLRVSIDLYQSTNLENETPRLLYGLVIIYFHAKKLDLAEKMLLEMSRVADRVGDESWQITIVYGLSDISALKGSGLSTQISYIELALKLAKRKKNNKLQVAYILGDLGVLYLRNNQKKLADQCIWESVEIFNGEGKKIPDYLYTAINKDKNIISSFLWNRNKNKPFISNEYIADTSNSSGGLDRLYRDILEIDFASIGL